MWSLVEFFRSFKHLKFYVQRFTRTNGNKTEHAYSFSLSDIRILDDKNRRIKLNSKQLSL
jgi:hypothetical protein